MSPLAAGVRGLGSDQLKRMKELGTEDGPLRKAVAALTRDQLILQDAEPGRRGGAHGRSRGTGAPVRPPGLSQDPGPARGAGRGVDHKRVERIWRGEGQGAGPPAQARSPHPGDQEREGGEGETEARGEAARGRHNAAAAALFPQGRVAWPATAAGGVSSAAKPPRHNGQLSRASSGSASAGVTPPTRSLRQAVPAMAGPAASRATAVRMERSSRKATRKRPSSTAPASFLLSCNRSTGHTLIMRAEGDARTARS